MYEYRARLVRVVDADTLDLCVDCGFRLSVTDRFRLLGVNAPELATPAGKAARAWLDDRLARAGAAGSAAAPWPLLIRTEHDRREKFGRWLAVVVVPGPAAWDVAAELVAAGHAVVAHY